jgi:hypothetical protein
MTRTPDVVDATAITTAWGNEIRDRTTQIFATTAERDAWLAPNGALAVVTATNYVYQRVNQAWVLLNSTYVTPIPYKSGATSTNTDPNGVGYISHGLGVTPSVVQLTASANPANLMAVRLASRDASVISFAAYSNSGALIVNTTVAVHWTVFR